LPPLRRRIREVKVDGGSDPVSDVGGSLETPLDVEQSGGISPGSKVTVYEGPNTDQGFIDAFASAIDSNTADTISCSGGEWEFFDLAAQGNVVTDPVTGRSASALRAVNDLFMQAALQGHSMYVAAGDAGAYDDTDFFMPPSWPLPPHAVARCGTSRTATIGTITRIAATIRARELAYLTFQIS
jgi:subtilase family serine protease